MSDTERIRLELLSIAVRLMALKIQVRRSDCPSDRTDSLNDAYDRLIDSINDTKRLLVDRRSRTKLASFFVELDDQMEEKFAPDLGCIAGTGEAADCEYIIECVRIDETQK